MGYWNRKMICPFYLWDTKQRIGCEGKHILTFDSKKDIKKWMADFCTGFGYKKCPHADKMTKFYEENANGKSQD